MTPRDRLLAAVRAVPAGQTTAQIAARLNGVKLQTISARLSALAMYGVIDRERVFSRTGEAPRHWCIWRPKNANQ